MVHKIKLVALVFIISGMFSCKKDAVVNTAPTVSITSPANNATFANSGTIAITASATDADGSIVKVEFYSGATLIGTVTTSPYTFTWTGVTAGKYALTAKATDNSGAETISAAVNITVNSAPTVNITSPANNAAFATPGTIAITASATDADGSIAKVEFYNGATLIGTVTTSPYTFTWTGVTEGNYSLTAKATDNSGATTTSTAVNVTVNITFKATLNGANERPTPNASTATGSSTLIFDINTKLLTITTTYSGLTGTASGAHIHKGDVTVAGSIIFGFTSLISPIVYTSIALDATQEADLKANLYYVNVHSTPTYPGGEIRGQLIKQ